MPVDDSELPLGLEARRDGACQAELIRDAVEGIGEENVIDRLLHDRIDIHGVRHDKLAVGGACAAMRVRARSGMAGSMSMA